MIRRPTLFDEIWVHHTDDVLDQLDTVSLSDLDTVPVSNRNRAGVDDLTPVDTFVFLNGTSCFITENENEDYL